jgi:hypothetical protein
MIDRGLDLQARHADAMPRLGAVKVTFALLEMGHLLTGTSGFPSCGLQSSAGRGY